jgi:hypothetical protein
VSVDRLVKVASAEQGLLAEEMGKHQVLLAENVEQERKCR